MSTDELQLLQDILAQCQAANVQMRAMFESQVAAVIIMIWTMFWANQR